MNIDFLTLDGILLLAFCLFVFIQLFYFWVIFSRFAFYKQKVKPGEIDFPVSVVISAKNEFTNLKKNLPLILNQTYRRFEVVVVNDVSDDETIFLLEDLAREYKHLSVVNLHQDLNFFKGKKFPLALGIKSAKYENLLLTDADCTPGSELWIETMVWQFDREIQIVLGYGKHNESTGFLNRIIRYETAFTALQYFSLALLGLPYMGVGRNLAYKKTLFLQTKGFISHYNVSSGDDDLFINKVANKKNTAIQVNESGFTLSETKKTYAEWWRQKRRHLSTGKFYKFKHKLVLGLYSFSFFVMLVLFVILLAKALYFNIVISLFVVRYFSQLVIFKKTYSQLNEKKLLVLSPLIELLITLIYPILVSINLVFKQSRWK
ncbi:MAG: glycosyltransferase [Bacteroidales bacterium]